MWCRFLPADAAVVGTAEYNEADMVYEAEDEKIPALPSVLTEVWYLVCTHSISVHSQVDNILVMSKHFKHFVFDCFYDAGNIMLPLLRFVLAHVLHVFSWLFCCALASLPRTQTCVEAAKPLSPASVTHLLDACTKAVRGKLPSQLSWARVCPCRRYTLGNCHMKLAHLLCCC